MARSRPAATPPGPLTTLEVNGRARTVGADAEAPLIFALRNELGLKGVRSACAIGACGACTVLADGEPVRACVTPLSAVAGAAITTPEGLAGEDGSPHPVQAAFLEERAAQCGYCINGIIMSTAAEAASPGRVRHPGGERAGGPGDRSWLDGHLCRCGTHARIRRAVDAVLEPPGGAAEVPGGAAEVPGGVHRAEEDPLPPGRPAAPATTDPPDHERVEAWLRLAPGGRVEVRSGRVELGQGIREAMARIVAAHAGVDGGLVVVAGAETGSVPDEGYTSGTNSVDHGGVALARAAVAFRRGLLSLAGEAMGRSPADLTVEGDRVDAPDGTGIPLRDLAERGEVRGRIEPSDEPAWDRLAGAEPAGRADLAAKLGGRPAYVQDLDLPGMLHARAHLPPVPDASLRALDPSGAEALDGLAGLVVDGRVLLALAEREEVAVRAAARLAAGARWDVPAGTVDAPTVHEALLRATDTEPYVAAAADGPPPGGAAHRATYTAPYQAHGSVAPSCAVAGWGGERLRVYTHSQGIYPLRAALADLVGVPVGQVEVAHRPGPGCYGHNLADDAAAFAVLAAGAAGGRPVRFQFSASDEFGWEPLGPAMVAELGAGLDGARRVSSWRHRSVTGYHRGRPGGSAAGLAPAWLREDARQPLRPRPSESGIRGGVPPYAFPAVEAVADHVRGPLRTGQLRSLGAYLNTFASESFMDEMAERAGADPLAFRLAHLEDPRARRVLEAAASAADHRAHVGPSGRGLGLALARYKNTKAYVAAAVEVSIDTHSGEIAVSRVVLACDAGTVVDPDGARNQLEGGAIQGLSRALHEEVRFDRSGVRSRDWLEYPVLPLSATPAVDVLLARAPGSPPLGVGEVSVGPAAAALANAVDDAVGIRLRDLPLTPRRVTDRLLTMDAAEASRVLV